MTSTHAPGMTRTRPDPSRAPGPQDRSRPRRTAATVLLGLLLGLTSLVGVQSASVAPAQANASGCSDWGNIPYISVPSGYMCFTVTGNGRSVDSMRATWRTSTLCNWRIDFFAYNEAGQQVWKSSGPTTAGCTGVSGGRLRATSLLAPMYGRVCARVYSHNTWVTGVCHSITP